MEALLLRSQGVAAAALLPASRPRRGGTRFLLRLRTRAQQASNARSVRQLVTIDDLDHHAVNGRTPAGTPTVAEGARVVVVGTGTGTGTGTAAQRLHAIAEAAADRAEMHDIVGRQRDSWNHLLLHSTNTLALAASVMAALAPASPTLAALRAAAGALLATAAVTMAAVNAIQPSQLAEEQRNATRLWRQLERDVRAALGGHAAATATAPAMAMAIAEADVHDAMDRVLALDAAYPLPLFPGMLDKFPATVEPTRWWPPRRQPPPARRAALAVAAGNGNGWTRELEDEMRGVVRVLRAKDEREHVSNAKLALRMNRGLAVAGPALAGTAALATAFIDCSCDAAGVRAAGAAVLCGALAASANTAAHGWQVGMLFDMFRNVAGFYRKIQEDIEACLDEVDVERRENGEVFRTKVALLLGRSTADLTKFREMASPAFKDEDINDFAGKLF